LRKVTINFVMSVHSFVLPFVWSFG